MAQPYRKITSELAGQIKLVMTDVDGTLTSGDGSFSSKVQEAVRSLEARGIAVGLISGRSLYKLDSFAELLGVSGPIIAENGGVARINKEGKLLDLGYDQHAAREILEKLGRLYPHSIEDGEWNKQRTVDMVVRIKGINTEELKRYLGDVELLNSGYVFHLLPKGINKGSTLHKVLERACDGQLSPTEVLVIGDAPTDLSLFEQFPNSVLVPNPSLPSENMEILLDTARYVSDSAYGEGFAEVAMHIVNSRVYGN